MENFTEFEFQDLLLFFTLEKIGKRTHPNNFEQEI